MLAPPNLISLRSIALQYQIHRDTLEHILNAGGIEVVRIPARDGRRWRYVRLIEMAEVCLLLAIRGYRCAANPSRRHRYRKRRAS